MATRADWQRVQGWRSLWQNALGAARGQGFAGEIEREGLLLHPDAGQADPAPPSGAYRCRLIRLGGTRAYNSYRPVACRIDVEGPFLLFRVTEGAQRPSGRIYDGDLGRRMFIGTMAIGDERRAPVYGADQTRDMIGVFQALPAERWRLILPQPRWGATIEMIELRPSE